MFKSTLIETLRTFGKQDMKEFGLFIQSPFFNTNQSVIKLYEQIKKLYPEFDEKMSDKKLLFEKSFGKIKYNDSFMRMTVFRFLELTKEFLVHKNLQRNNLMKETMLLDELNIRELNNLMMKSVQELDKKIEKLKSKEAEAYLAKYRLEYCKNDIKSRDTKMITYKDTLDKDLMIEQKSLNIFFFMSSLKFFQYFLNQKNFVVNAEGYPDFMNNIMEYLENNDEYLSVRVLKIYYYLVRTLISKDDKYFFDLKKILFEDKEDISYTEKFNLIAVLRNYCHQKALEGSKDFNTIQFDILKFSIEKNILNPLEGGKYMSELRFMNVVWIGLSVREFNWVEGFIKKYLNRIEPDQRQYVFAYNTARLKFEKGNYTEALDELGKSGSIKNAFYKAAIKQLTLMIYYELHWIVPAADLLDAYRHFIRTDKLLPELHKNGCNAFINHFGRLLKLNDNSKDNEFEISKLIDELKTTPQTWFLRKAEQLLN